MEVAARESDRNYHTVDINNRSYEAEQVIYHARFFSGSFNHARSGVPPSILTVEHSKLDPIRPYRFHTTIPPRTERATQVRTTHRCAHIDVVHTARSGNGVHVARVHALNPCQHLSRAGIFSDSRPEQEQRTLTNTRSRLWDTVTYGPR